MIIGRRLKTEDRYDGFAARMAPSGCVELLGRANLRIPVNDWIWPGAEFVTLKSAHLLTMGQYYKLPGGKAATGRRRRCDFREGKFRGTDVRAEIRKQSGCAKAMRVARNS